MPLFRWLQLDGLPPSKRQMLAALSLYFFQSPFVLAFDFNDAEVTEDNGIFKITVSAVIAAPAEYIRYVLADYAHIYRLSPSIIESEVLPSSPAGEKQVRTRLLCCNPVFCREVERVDIVRMLSSGDLEAEIVPELSEFKSGRATWKITPMGEHSHLVYEADLEPDFFIPPVVGTSMIINNLRDEFTTTFIRVEKIARMNAQKDRNTENFLSDASAHTLKAPCNRKASANLQ